MKGFFAKEEFLKMVRAVGWEMKGKTVPT